MATSDTRSEHAAAAVARFGLTMIEPLRAPSAPLLARVRDSEGATFILKRTRETPEDAHEGDAMVVLAAAGLAPKTEPLEPNLLLIDDIGPCTLPRDDDPDATAAVARLARAIHALPSDARWIPLQQSWTDWRRQNPVHASFSKLPADRARRAAELIDELASGPAETSFLHGDLHHRNIFVHAGTLKVVDPHALIGDRAYDLAFFASRCLVPENALETLLDAYGEALPRAHEWLEFCCLYTASQLPYWDEPAAPGLREMLGLPAQWWR